MTLINPSIQIYVEDRDIFDNSLNYYSYSNRLLVNHDSSIYVYKSGNEYHGLVNTKEYRIAYGTMMIPLLILIAPFGIYVF